MSNNMSNDKNIPDDAEAYYETLASQEEIYLEETEEELRVVLISYDTSLLPDRGPASAKNRGLGGPDWGERSMSDPNNDPCMAESLDDQLNRAAEDLITGDSDDPPLSREAVAEMLRLIQMPKRLGQTRGVS